MVEESDIKRKKFTGKEKCFDSEKFALEAVMKKKSKSGDVVKPMPANTAMGRARVVSQERGSPSWTSVVAEVHVDPSSGETTLKKLN